MSEPSNYTRNPRPCKQRHDLDREHVTRNWIFIEKEFTFLEVMD